MKILRICLPLLLLSISAGALAQDDSEARAEMEAREAEFAERMRAAEERLEEAARRVAELSSERLGAMGEARRFEFEYMGRPIIGINIDNEGDEPVEGVQVLSVTPGSAADDAGLRAGDIITAVNGESMSGSSSKEATGKLLDFMKGVEEGDELDIEYLRNGNIGTVALTPRTAEANVFAWAFPGDGMALPRPPNVHVAPRAMQSYRFALGGLRGGLRDMEIVELSEGLGRYFGTDKGLLVIRAPKANAYQLQDGDVITRIDGREPSSINHCMRILGSYQPGEKLTLHILRDKQPQTIEVEIPDDRVGSLIAPLPVSPAAAPLPEAAPRAPRPSDRT